MGAPERRIGAVRFRARIVSLLTLATAVAVPAQNLPDIQAGLPQGLGIVTIKASWLAVGLVFLVSGLLADVFRSRIRLRRLTTQLARTRQLLAREEARKQRIEARMKRQSRLLGQRVRETDCLYALSKVFTNRDLSWEEACRRTMDLLPRFFLDRSRVSARLVCHGREFRTPAFRAHDVVVARPILVQGGRIGEIEFHYSDRRDPEYRLLFLGRERTLLDDIAERLVNYFERQTSDRRADAARIEAERASQAKSRFFAAASHDLRQPLQAMHLFLHTLSQRHDSEDDRRILSLLSQALDHTDELLRPLLEVAKLDAGTIRPERVAVPASHVFSELGKRYLHRALEKRLSLTIVPSWAVLWTDPILLQRILDCLMCNAITHTEEGRILVGLRRRKGRARIEVWDTGPGISEIHANAVFQEFYQIGNEERDRRHGLGLGLAIAERTARLLDHPIGLKSIPGKGSAFHVDVQMASHSLLPGWQAEETRSRRFA